MTRAACVRPVCGHYLLFAPTPINVPPQFECLTEEGTASVDTTKQTKSLGVKIGFGKPTKVSIERVNYPQIQSRKGWSSSFEVQTP